TGVRVRWHDHAAGARGDVRPVVVEEAPGADERPLTRGQRAPDRHRPRTAERDVAGLDELDGAAPVPGTLVPGGAVQLGRVAFGVAHRPMLATAAFHPRSRVTWHVSPTGPRDTTRPTGSHGRSALSLIARTGARTCPRHPRAGHPPRRRATAP